MRARISVSSADNRHGRHHPDAAARQGESSAGADTSRNLTRVGRPVTPGGREKFRSRSVGATVHHHQAEVQGTGGDQSSTRVALVAPPGRGTSHLEPEARAPGLLLRWIYLSVAGWPGHMGLFLPSTPLKVRTAPLPPRTSTFITRTPRLHFITCRLVPALLPGGGCQGTRSVLDRRLSGGDLDQPRS